MLKIFYRDKVITFCSKNNNYDPNQLLFYSGEPKMLDISILFKKLDYVNELHIICDDINLSFSTFAHQFVLIDAAGGVVCSQNGAILMINRNSKWDLPKGKREIDEAIEDCALREVQEECGIANLTLDKFIMKTLHTFVMNGVWCLKTTYWYRMYGSENELLTPQIEEGITEVKWIPLQDQDRYINDSYKTIIDVVNKNNII